MPAVQTVHGDNWWRPAVPGLALIFGVACELSSNSPREFIDLIMPKIGHIHVVVRYMHAMTAYRAHGDALAGFELRDQAQSWLEDAGWQVGTIQQGWHRGEKQAQVRYNGVRYVSSRGRHPYRLSLAHVGREALFHPSNSTPLTVNGSVRAADFIPVDGN